MSELILKGSDVRKYNEWVRTINEKMYRPYLTVRKVNKYGRRHWLWCDIQKREVHLLSDGERRAYEIMISQPGTVSIFEQYALDVNETLSIAQDLGFVHPRNYKTKQLSVMTTDFLVVTQTCDLSGCVDIKKTAYTFKYTTELYTDSSCTGFLNSATRTIQKLKIEQEYWKRRGIEYRLLTEVFATKERHWNILFCRLNPVKVVDVKLAMEFSIILSKIWIANRYCSLQELIIMCSNVMGIKEYTSESLFKYSALNGFIKLKHTSCIQLYRAIELE